VSYIEQSQMTKKDVSLSGVANGTLPLKVVIVPRFLISIIEQSNPVSGAINTLTVNLMTDVTFGSGSTVTISGLTGSQTADTATLAINSTSNCFRAAGVWTKVSGQLVLTASGLVSAGKPVVVTFSLINPATKQTSPRVMVEAEMKDGLGAALGSIFPLEMKKPGTESRSLLQNLARSCGVDGRQACSAAQSSVANGGEASRAVDNNIDTLWGGGSVTHTNDEAYPWWMVDFGRQVKISGLRVYNRGDCCQEYLQGFTVYIGNSSLGTLGNTDQDTKVRLVFSEPVTARYVRILPQTWSNHISMRAGLLLGQDIEVVPYARLQYSSTWDNNAKGTGHGQGMLDSPQAWSAGANDLNQWIQMDAGQVKTINGVVTQGRNGAGNHGMQFVRSCSIQTSIDGSTWRYEGIIQSSSNAACATYQNAPMVAPFWKDIMCPTPLTGRYLYIHSLQGPRLMLAEVQVYGEGFRTPDLHGVANGAHPLEVVVPGFSVKYIQQSTPSTSANNTLIVTLTANCNLGSGSTVTITGLTGSQTSDTSSLPVTSTRSQFGTKGNWAQTAGILVLTASHVVTSGLPVVLTFTLINPAMSQTSPPVRVGAVIVNRGIVIGSIDAELMTLRTESLYGVIKGYNPLQVLRPAFTLKSIEQSTFFAGASNTITMTLRTNYRLASGSTVTITGLTGSQTASSSSLPITSTYNQLGTSGEWEKESGTLKLTVSALGSFSHCGTNGYVCGGHPRGEESYCSYWSGNSACDGSGSCRSPAVCVQSMIIEDSIYTLTFDLINPETSQPSPEVRVLAEIKNAGSIVSYIEQSQMTKKGFSPQETCDSRM
jgi:hypothetical protein